MVVDVAEDGAGADSVGAILGVDELAEAVHDHGAVLGLALLLVLLRLHNANKSAKMRWVTDIMVGFLTNLDFLFIFFYLRFSLEAQGAPMSLVVKLVVGVHDSAQVDTANLLSGTFTLQVVEQTVDDATHAALVFQIVHIFWREGEKIQCATSKSKKEENIRKSQKSGMKLSFHLYHVQYGISILTVHFSIKTNREDQLRKEKYLFMFMS